MKKYSVVVSSLFLCVRLFCADQQTAEEKKLFEDTYITIENATTEKEAQEALTVFEKPDTIRWGIAQNCLSFNMLLHATVKGTLTKPATMLSLLKAGAKPDVLDNDNMSPLHWTLQRLFWNYSHNSASPYIENRLLCLKQLLQHGANINIKKANLYPDIDTGNYLRPLDSYVGNTDAVVPLAIQNIFLAHIGPDRPLEMINYSLYKQMHGAYWHKKCTQVVGIIDQHEHRLPHDMAVLITQYVPDPLMEYQEPQRKSFRDLRRHNKIKVVLNHPVYRVPSNEK